MYVSEQKVKSRIEVKIEQNKIKVRLLTLQNVFTLTLYLRTRRNIHKQIVKGDRFKPVTPVIITPNQRTDNVERCDRLKSIPLYHIFVYFLSCM